MGTRGMSIDSMRVGGGRCPPLLVGGLIIACIMMVCNWWTLSSTNLELLRQIDELNEQIKISVEERDQCVTQKENTEKQFKGSQDDARTTHVKLSQVEDALTTCNQELKSYQQMDVTKTATLEALRVDKNTISARLNTKIEEVKKLEDELSQVKEELEKTKLSLNSPLEKKIPPIPIANLARLKASSIPQLGPVKKSAVEISIGGQKGLHFHGIPVLPRDPPGAVRLPPRFSVTKLKPRLLEKHDNKSVKTGENAAKENDVNLLNKTVNTSGNQPQNPQVNAPPNVINEQGQDIQDKDNSNPKDDNAAEVPDGANPADADFNFNLKPDVKFRDTENK